MDNTFQKVIEYDPVKILWDLQIQNNKMVMTNQLDIDVVVMQENEAVMVGVRKNIK